MNTITCEQAQAWFRGANPEPERCAEYESHLIACPHCRTLWAERETVAAIEPLVQARYPFLQAPSEPGGSYRIGHYEIREILGTGAMGIVFRAWDLSLPREVALKVLPPELACNPRARDLFVQEARSAARLRHDNVVTLHEVAAQHEPPYLVMELVPGQTLAEYLQTHPQPSLERIRQIGMQLASGLAHAHQAGVIHHDIKPANIVVEATPEGKVHVKIVDFGLAGVAADLARAGNLVGTPAYMAPEQARGSACDQRADLFSLGSVLYELCTGQQPFQGENLWAVLDQVKTARPLPVRTLNPAIPVWFARIIERLQDPDPSRRYQNAADVARDIEKGPPRIRPGILVVMLMLLVGGGVLAAGSFRGWWREEPLNERLTREAWEAFERKDHARVIEKAGECVREFHGAAVRRQAQLEKEQATLPTEGSLTPEVKAAIHANGLLNDVCTCYWLLGRTHALRDEVAQARKFYELGAKLTFGRCIERNQTHYFSPALKAEDDLHLLNESNP